MVQAFDFAQGLVTVEVFTGTEAEYAALSTRRWNAKVVKGRVVAARVSLNGPQVAPVKECEAVVS